MTNSVGAAAIDAAAPNLVVENLSKAFGGARALDGVSFTVAAGEVHGLLGQNGSGKSTLIKILGGVYSPDGGAVSVGGRRLPLPLPPGEFSRYGIAIVHQALGLVPSLSVTENLFVRRLVRDRQWFIDWRRARRDAEALFETYGLKLNARAPVSELAPVERALLAIIRAFHEIEESRQGATGGLLILDEPTPFLSRDDVERLFTLVRRCAQQGSSVIFVSHDVDEVKELTDRATVLRNGRVAATLVTREASKADFIASIVGRSLESVPPRPQTFAGAPTISVAGLGADRIAPLDLALHAGEVVGLTGLIGSGYDRIPYLLYGADEAGAGTLQLGGARHAIADMTPRRAFELGMVLIPADRPVAGVVDALSVADNIALPMLGRTIPGGWVTESRVRALAEGIVRRFDVRPPKPDLPVRALSGGNQQKVVLGKWLQADPTLILLDEPTQGVDVGAREQVFDMVRAAARKGATVLCASSDHEQLAAICDRVLVFSRGRVDSVLVGADVTKDAIADRCFNSLSGQLSAAGVAA